MTPTTSRTPDQHQLASLANPIEKELCERSLYFFVKSAWPIIDPAPFVPARHIEVMCEALEKASRREIQRLLINVPPGSAKSLVCCVFFVAWTWIRHPEERFICGSHSLKLATIHSVLCRELIESTWYQQRWGDRFKLTDDQNQKTSYRNDKGGHRNVCSPGNGTGDSAEFVIVDDGHEIGDISADSLQRVIDWYDRTLGSRIRDPERGVRIVIGQRVAMDDISGHCIKSGGYHHICLPAEFEQNHPYVCQEDWRTEDGEPLWPQRNGSEVLAEEHKRLGSIVYATLHQQRPTPPGGTIIKTAWLKYYTSLPEYFDTIVQSWDLNLTGGKGSDFVCGQLWGRAGANFYLIDMVTGQWDFPETIKQIRSFSAAHPQAITKLVENRANGAAAIATLKSEISGLIAVNPTKSKELRLIGVSPLFESGNVFLPLNAHFTEDFVHQLTTFPAVKHDDQCDACSQALERLSSQLDSFQSSTWM